MQVMPATAKDPGFGIKPARDNSPDELRRVGDEYASILLNRYQDPKLAMIAYNMGPGATDKWLASGADIRKLPKETQGYIRGVNLAEGGEVKRFQVGGTMGGFDDAYTDLGIPLTKPEIDEYTVDPMTGEKLFSGYRGKSTAKQPKKETQKVDDAETIQSAPAVTTAPPAAETPRADAEKDTYNLMKYIQDRQAKIDKAAEGDQNLALLAAGLGMLGGTSPYAFENIGKGGLAGVQQLGQLQKLRATQGIASDKMLGTAYNAEMLGKLRKDQLAQGNSVRYANALNSVREERVKQTGKYLERPEYMDLGMMQTYAQRLSKNPNDKEARAKYDSLLTKKQSLENKIKKDLPDPDPALYGISGGSSNVIKLK
jgi:hypothetical protein